MKTPPTMFDLWWSARCAERDGEPMTYEQIAAVLGVDPSRVRQLEERALRKLRAALGEEFAP